MNPLRVLHLMDGLGLGGAERQLLLLLQHTPRERFTHLVCHVSSHAELAPYFQEQGISVRSLAIGGRRSLVGAVAGVIRSMAVFRPNLIHADGIYSRILAAATGRLTLTPVLTTVGSPVRWPREVRELRRAVLHSRSKHRSLLRFVHQRVWRQPNVQIMAVSEAVRQNLLDAHRVPAFRISVVLRGVDLQVMTPDASPAIGRLRRDLIPGGAWPVLLNVGRLTPEKGQEYAIRALPSVRRRFPDAVLLLAGDGVLRKHLAEVAHECGVAESVRLLGSRDDVPALLQCADIFVLPSLIEGAAGALLEAMAMRLPVVATSIPAVVEAAGDVVQLVPPADPQGLAEGIVTVAEASDETRAAMGQRERIIVESRYDIRAHAAAFATLCERVAGRIDLEFDSPALAASKKA